MKKDNIKKINDIVSKLENTEEILQTITESKDYEKIKDLVSNLKDEKIFETLKDLEEGKEIELTKELKELKKSEVFKNAEKFIKNSEVYEDIEKISKNIKKEKNKSFKNKKHFKTFNKGRNYYLRQNIKNIKFLSTTQNYKRIIIKFLKSSNIKEWFDRKFEIITWGTSEEQSFFTDKQKIEFTSIVHNLKGETNKKVSFEIETSILRRKIYNMKDLLTILYKNIRLV